MNNLRITNVEIKEILTKTMKNLVGVFHSDDVSRFMQQFDVSMKQKQSPYTFVILTTERAVEEK